MSNKNSQEIRPKFGAGHVQAMGRLGLAELRNAVAMGNSNVVAPTEPGLYGTATPSEVVDQRQNDLQSPLDERGSVLGERLNQVDRQVEASRDARSTDRNALEKE